MGDHPGPPLPPDALDEWQRWRERTLTGLLRTTAFVVFALGVIATIQVRSVPFAIVSGVVSALMLVAALRRSMAFRLRAAALITGLYIGATAATALGGLSPNVLVAMCACVVMGTLLLGRRWGIAVVLVAAATVAVVVPLRNAGVLPVDTRISYEHPDGRTVARVVAAFVFLASAIVASVSHLLVRAEEVFLQKSRALETLEREQARRRETDEQLRHTEAAFQKARELEILGRLSSSVAHDFNNALLIIQANADLARLRPSYVETALDHIDVAIRQAAATTRQLRAFSPQAQQPSHPLSLMETLSREAELLKRILPANIELRLDLPQGDLTVLGDEGQIQSLLTNLALNARDAMPEGGSLAIGLRGATPGERDGGGELAVIDVADTGVGMSRETAARIFEPFFTTKGAAGTGLGLASVRAIVHEAGGRIEVESAVGRGTRFRIFWPVHRAPPSSSPVRADRGAPASGTVLVVDDDDAVRAAITEPLSWRGYTVLEARTGADALLIARRHTAPIDVLCVDLVMPGMPTRQLVDGLRAAHPEVRVLLCSGYLAEGTPPPFEMLDAFLAKPFSPDTLAGVVRKLVAREDDVARAPGP